MSKQRCATAYLAGYDGPFFPPSLDKLSDTLGDYRASWNELKAIAGKIPGYEKLHGHSYTTSDGYTWFARLAFTTATDRVIILIPWLKDRSKSDGTLTDRSIAIYSMTGDQAAVNDIVEAYAEGWIEHLASQIDRLWKTSQDPWAQRPNDRWPR